MAFSGSIHTFVVASSRKDEEINILRHEVLLEGFWKQRERSKHVAGGRKRQCRENPWI